MIKSIDWIDLSKIDGYKSFFTDVTEPESVILSQECEGVTKYAILILSEYENIKGSEQAKKWHVLDKSEREAFQAKIVEIIKKKMAPFESSSKDSELSKVPLQREISAPSQVKDSLKEVCVTGLKGETAFQVRDLQKKYQNFDLLKHVEKRYVYARKFFEQSLAQKTSPPGFETEADRQGILRIIKNRKNFFDLCKIMYDYQYKIEEGSELFATKICDLAGELESTKASKNINLLEDGTKTFSIPVGSKTHLVALEFRKIKDNYFIILHNRGIHSSDTRLHGCANFENLGKRYAKTSVTLETTKEKILDRNFLKKLFSLTLERDITLFYEAFLQHFQDSPIIKSDVEKTVEELYVQYLNPFIGEVTKRNIKNCALKLMDLDPAYSSLQLYETCVESSITPTEKMLATDRSRWALKIYTVSSIVDDLSKEIWQKNPDIDAAIHFSNNLVKKNKNKLENPKKLKGHAEELFKTARSLIEKSKEAVDCPQIEKTIVYYFETQFAPLFFRQNVLLKDEEIKTLLKRIDTSLLSDMSIQQLETFFIMCKWQIDGLKKANFNSELPLYRALERVQEFCKKRLEYYKKKTFRSREFEVQFITVLTKINNCLNNMTDENFKYITAKLKKNHQLLRALPGKTPMLSPIFLSKLLNECDRIVQKLETELKATPEQKNKLIADVSKIIELANKLTPSED